MNQKKGGISVMGKVSMPQGKGSQLHNRREYEKIGKPIPDNIDSSKTAENITLVDRDIPVSYTHLTLPTSDLV